MIKTALLFCAFGSPHVLDKVDLSHNFAKGTVLSYTVGLEIVDEEVNASATLKWTYGDKEEKGVKTDVKPEKLSIRVGGNDLGESANDKTFFLDSFGMPDDITMSGPGTLLVIAHVCTYLPAKPLEPGDSFGVDWKRGDATLKGKGTFTGVEKVGDKDLARLVMNLTLTPHGDENGVGTLDFVSYFDPTTGHIVSAKGTGAVDEHEFKFELSLVPVK